jgi:hypothetical protein
VSFFDQVSSPFGVGAAPFRPPVVIQPNDSTLSAVSKGGISANQVISGPGNVGAGAGNAGGFGATAQTVLGTLVTCGANGSTSPLANNPGGSPNVGMPSSGPAANPANGGNPGALPELQSNAPASALVLVSGQFGG